ncbi:HK97 family phage prohead protease [Eisenbergiella massiliensis]|uniref:HK97 family phage prohead protease n=2 Tax=Eisenbergiella massiliensis TaxID=1720294 RepID=A0A3E3J0C8_9FIRM|nr:HK97 family phage prohead protease [Eisenbergiella massiliensis]
MQFKLDSYNEEEGIFSGYGAVFSNVDTGGDIIEPGAFTKTLAEGWERVKILALHNDCWLPIGRPIELREDANGLYLSAKVSDTSMGKDIKVLLKDGVLNELSIGYDPVVFDYDAEGIRHLREIKLWEVSVVTWAMNPEAKITGYKSMQEAAERALEIEQELAKDMKAGRKISNMRLKSLQDASKAMKKASSIIDAVIREVEGAKKVNPGKESKSISVREVEIYF